MMQAAGAQTLFPAYITYVGKCWTASQIQKNLYYFGSAMVPILGKRAKGNLFAGKPKYAMNMVFQELQKLWVERTRY
jgi:hypothetical protein